MSTGLAPVYGLDNSAPDTPGFMGALTRPAEDFARDADAGRKPVAVNELSDERVLSRTREAHEQAKRYYDGNLAASWERSYKAFRNEHFKGSKYLSPEFRGRSKLFRPKTRSAVRKQMTNAVNALFANPDAVTISAQDESNEQQRASAALKQEILNYRLSRKSHRAGIRWFMVTMGARQDSTITGVCVSKQYWRFREDDEGNVLEDRPSVDLFPGENVLCDPNADWTNPAQTGAYFILRHPMTAEDAMEMIDATRGSIPWIEGITIQSLAAGGNSSNAESATSTRQARTGGTDPKTDATGVFQQIWLHEVYMRIQGREYVYWTLGTTKLLSRPQKLREAYPCYNGERPIVMGYGSFEAHRTFPMAPVESWQPLQMEANDVANLRLDHMKLLVNRPMQIKRGAKVDIQQVQRRGPGSVILLNNHEDIQAEEIPDVPQSAYVESQYINSDMDELTGTFSTGSVQTNRSLNETVGGMKLLAGDANSIGEFDLAVFVETWVEPVLYQIVKLEEYYETDATLLALAGKRAKLIEQFGINEITDELLQMDATVTVNVGVGSASTPAEKANRWLTAAQGVGQVLGPFMQMGLIKPPVPKVGEIVNTVFGGAGFHDAKERFFQAIDDDADFQEVQQKQAAQQGPPPDPEKEAKAAAIQQKAQMDGALAQQKMAQEAEIHQMRMEVERLKMQIAREKGQMEMAVAQVEYALKVQDANLEAEMRQKEAKLSASIQQNEAALRVQEAAMKAAFAQERHSIGIEGAQQKNAMIGQSKPKQ